jgi:7-cyano-7-deazaguanine reductase
MSMNTNPDAGRSQEELKRITILGKQGTQYPFHYSPEVLETFDNKHPGRDYFVKFNCPEFTSLCPITGQPDFACITVKYIPDRLIVESKSLKLYLQTFRNEETFYEHVVNVILDEFVSIVRPRRCKVTAAYAVRGGIAMTVETEYQRKK